MEIRISYAGRNVRREKKPCFSLVALIMTLLASGEVIIHSSQWHTAVTKRETAIGLDDLDNEVQIVSEERPGKRRAVERQLLQGNRSAAQRLPLQLAARQHVLVVCGEGSKQQRITLRLQPRVPLIYLYSVRRAPSRDISTARAAAAAA